MAPGRAAAACILPVQALAGDAMAGPEPEECSPFSHCEMFPQNDCVWGKMPRSSGGIPGIASLQPQDFQPLAYSGFSDVHRWQVWCAAVGSSNRDFQPAFYCRLVSAGADGEFARQIRLDVPRTLAGMAAFGERQQQRLFRILCAYASLNPDVGYCQGMNSIAGLIMLVAGADEEEEEVFRFFASLMDEGGLRDLYTLGFPLLQRCICGLDELMSELEPELSEHLLAQDVQPAMYLHQWILTLFVDVLPLPTVLAFWDVIICCGFESLIKLTASLLQCLKQTLLGHELEGIVYTLRQLRVAVDSEAAVFCREVLKRFADLCLPDHIIQLLQPGAPSGVSSPGHHADHGSHFPINNASRLSEAKSSVHLPTLPSLPVFSKFAPRLTARRGAKSAKGAGCRQQSRKQRSAWSATVQTPILISAS